MPFATVGEVLAHYLSEKKDKAIAFDRLCFAAQALGPFFADLAPEEITRAKSREYAEYRRRKVSLQTVRKELSVLDTALKFADGAGRLRGAFNVVLPKKAGPRDVYLSRQELRDLLRVSAPHLRRFILISWFMGRRRSAVLALRWTPGRDGGWVDLQRARIHFLAEGDGESRKGKGSAPIPAPLQRLLRRWRREDAASGQTCVVHFRGKPVASVRKSLEAAARRAGLESRRVTPHVLKHTAVTRFFQLGGLPADGEDFFATSQETLMKVYRKHHPSFARRGAEIMGRVRRPSGD